MKQYVGILTIIVLLSSYYVIFEDDAQIRMDNTWIKYYQNDTSLNRMLVDGQFRPYLMDGTSNMNRASVSRDININNETGIVIQRRDAMYKEGIYTVETITYDSNLDNIEDFPVEYKIKIYNAKGKVFKYYANLLTYNYDTEKFCHINNNNDVTYGCNINTWNFENNMKIDFDVGYYYGKVTKSGTFTLKYNIESDFEEYSIRLFDPDTITLYLNGLSEDRKYEYGHIAQLNSTHSSDLDVCYNIDAYGYGDNYTCTNSSEIYNFTTFTNQFKFNDSSEEINITSNSSFYINFNNQDNIQSASIDLYGYNSTNYPSNIKIDIENDSIIDNNLVGELQEDLFYINENSESETTTNITLGIGDLTTQYITMPCGVTADTIDLITSTTEINITVDTLSDYSTSKNIKFTANDLSEIIYLKIPYGVTMQTAEWNITGVLDTYTETIYPVADSEVKLSNPNTNYGTNTNINVITTDNIGYFKFDYDDVTYPISSINYATFYIKKDGTRISRIDLFSVYDDSWTENGITWNNQPSPFNNFVQLEIATPYDYASLGNYAKEHSADNLISFALIDLYATGSAKFFSREFITSPPYLVVNYIANGPSISTDTGNNGITDNTTNTTAVPVTIDLNITAIQNYMNDSCIDSICYVPIKLTADKAGTIKIDDISIIFNATITSLDVDIYNDGIVDYSTDNFPKDNNVTISFKSSDMTDYLADNDNCDNITTDVPIIFVTDTYGNLTIEEIDFRYSGNNIPLNYSAFNLNSSLNTTKDVEIEITANAFGSIEFLGLNIPFYGDQNISVMAFQSDDTSINDTQIIEVIYSDKSITFPYTFMDYYYFTPLTNESQNVIPFGQTSLIGINDINNTGYVEPINVSIRLGESLTCSNISVSTDNNVTNAIQLTEDKQTIINNLTVDDSQYIWMWRDYACNPDDVSYIETNISIDICCSECVLCW